jgi:predicted metal-dependent hydrolase
MGYARRRVSHKSQRIAAMIASFQGQPLPAHYLGYFACFNRQQYYEAHDVLEDLWLANRHGPDGNFYKGLIQLAGAFVHLQKHRLQPAAALFRLAQRNLSAYPAVHHRLRLADAIAIADQALSVLEAPGDPPRNPLPTLGPPRLEPDASV